MDTALTVLITWKTLFVSLCFAMFFIGERLLPAAQEPARWPRIMNNLVLFGLNWILALVFVLPISEFAIQHAWGWRPDWWRGWSGFMLDLLLLDCALYWWHRWNHTHRLLWKFHEIHHLDQFLDTSSAVRFHFGEVALSALARSVIILTFGIPLFSIIIFETLILFAAIFHHSNLRLPNRFEKNLSLLFITPSIHWIHHHANHQDTNSNYGTILSLWDHLFRSRSHNKRTHTMPIGIEGQQDFPLAKLLLRPFRSQTKSSV